MSLVSQEERLFLRLRIASLCVILAATSLPGCIVVGLPPLVDDATSSDGTRSACPPVAQADMGSSVEIDQRLREQFPPGARSGDLESSLVSQGFQIVGSCISDPRIKIAYFRKEAIVLGYFFGLGFSVYWKVNYEDRIIWSKGFRGVPRPYPVSPV